MRTMREIAHFLQISRVKRQNRNEHLLNNFRSSVRESEICLNQVCASVIDSLFSHGAGAVRHTSRSDCAIASRLILANLSVACTVPWVD